MSNDFAHPGAPIDPVALARRDLKSLPRRFYQEVAVAQQGDGFAILLDQRPARTPAKAVLLLPSHALAEAVAEEWKSQGDVIDPKSMPLTRLANVAIDGIAHTSDPVIAEIAKYGESDLICYRAEGPDKLVKAEDDAWNPILAASEARIGARFLLVAGITFAQQPERTIEAVHSAVTLAAAGPAGHFRLAALHVMTALTGSVLVALAIGAGETSLDEAWAAAHVDEDFQISLWGEDQQAKARRAQRFEEMRAAVLLWNLLPADPD
jgi:chaperone required for assembly of F1-ATPase